MSSVVCHPDASGPKTETEHSLWGRLTRGCVPNSQDRQQAVYHLCRPFWFAPYGFLRRAGFDPQSARELTQALASGLLESRLRSDGKHAAGRFRCFVLDAAHELAASQLAQGQARKHIAESLVLPIDQQQAEWRYNDELQELQPDALFERAWAIDLTREVMRRLKAEYQRVDLDELFAILQCCLLQAGQDQVRRLSAQLNQSEQATELVLTRLRNRYRVLLQRLAADTVANGSDVDDELRYLTETLRVPARKTPQPLLNPSTSNHNPSGGVPPQAPLPNRFP